jgi:hypothetical protein
VYCDEKVNKDFDFFLFDLIRMFICGRHRIRILDLRSLKKLLRKSKCRVVAIGLGSDAGDPGSNLVNVMLRYQSVHVSVYTVQVLWFIL